MKLCRSSWPLNSKRIILAASSCVHERIAAGAITVSLLVHDKKAKCQTTGLTLLFPSSFLFFLCEVRGKRPQFYLCSSSFRAMLVIIPSDTLKKKKKNYGNFDWRTTILCRRGDLEPILTKLGSILHC